MNKGKLSVILAVLVLAIILLPQVVASNSTAPVDPALVPVSDILRNPPAAAPAAAHVSLADALREPAAKSAVSLADSLRERAGVSAAAHVSLAETLREPATKSAISLADSLRERAGSSSSMRGRTAKVSMADQLR